MSALADRARLLHLRALVAGGTRTILAVLSVASAAAVLVGVLCVPPSVSRAAERVRDLVPEDAVVIQPPAAGGIDADLAAELSEVEGARAVAPVVRRTVLIDGKATTLLGLDGAYTQLGTDLTPEACGFDPAKLGEGAIAGPELDVTEGDTVQVRGGAGTRTSVTVAGSIECPALSGLNGGRVLLLGIDAAREAAGMGEGADLLVVRLDPNVPDAREQVVRAVDDRAEVLDRQVQVEQARLAVAPLQQGLSVVCLIAALVAGFVVYSTVAASALARRRQFAVLRAIGLRRRSVRSGMLLESFVVGVIGGLLGAGLGIVVARFLVGQAPRLVVQAVGYEPTFYLPPLLIPAVVGGIALVSVLASIGPVRQLVSVQPVEALGGVMAQSSAPDEPQPTTRLWIIGTAMAIGAVAATSLGDGQASMASVPLGLGGAVVLVLAASSSLVAASAWVAARFGMPGSLAALDISGHRRHATSIMLASMIAISTVVGYQGLLVNIDSTYANRLSPIKAGDMVVKSGELGIIGFDQMIDPKLVDEIAAVDGVDHVEQRYEFLVQDDEAPVYGIGLEAGGQDPTTIDVSDEAVAAVQSGDAVIVNQVFAERNHAETGDTIDLQTATGPVEVEVAGVSEYYTLVPGGVVLMSDDHAAAWFGREAPSVVYVFLDDPTDTAVQAEVADTVAEFGDDSVSTVTSDEFFDGFTKEVGEIPGLLNSIIYATLIAATLAVLNAMLVALSERTRDLAVLRALGTRRKAMVRSVVIATCAVGAIGTALGLVLGIVMHPIHNNNLVRLAEGLAVDYRFEVGPVILGVIGAAVILVVGSVIPARRAVHHRIADSLRAEG